MKDNSPDKVQGKDTAKSGTSSSGTGPTVTGPLGASREWTRLMGGLLEGIQIIGYDWRYLYVNEQAARHGRRRPDELLGRTMMEVYPGIEHTELFTRMRHCMDERIAHRMENEFAYPDGTKGWFELSIEPVPEGLFILSVDITQRKRQEQKSAHFEGVLSTIRRVNQLIVQATKEEELLQGTCQILVDRRNYLMAWIGLVQEDSSDVLPVAQAGFEDGYLSTIKVTCDESKHGRGPTGTAIRTREPSVMRDIPQDERYAPWWDEAQKRGYSSSAAVPLMVEGTAIGALNVYSDHPDALDQAEIDMLMELAGDISMGLHRLRQQQEIERLERAYSALVEKSNDGVVVIRDGVVLFANTAMADMVGYRTEQALGRSFLEFVALGDREWIAEQHRRRMQGEDVKGLFDLTLLTRDGSERATEVNASVVDYEGSLADMAVVRDVTERRRLESSLRELLDRYRTTFEHTGTAMCIIETDTTISLANTEFCRLSGYTREEIEGKMSWQEFVVAEDRKRMLDYHHARREGRDAPKRYEFSFVDRSGESHAVHMAIDLIPGTTRTVASMIDITDRRQAEQDLRQARDRLERIVDNAFDVIAEFDAEGRMTSVSPGVEKVLGYQVDELLGKELAGILAEDDLPRAWDVLRQVLNGNSVQRLEFLFRHKDGQPVRAEINVLPIWEDNRPVRVQGTFRDITARRQAEDGMRQSLEELRKTRDGVIRAISDAVATRDPYTASHQERVTELACAIAGELGLKESNREALRVAGALHDLGKLQVPAEVLTKPGRLSDLQFGIVKEHPQTGYNILKHIDFPWPVADIVLQHHERLDGSGYPQGLKGHEMMVEAKILAVADVVEAMASHRPYRPALGIDAALNHVQEERGKLYDPHAVDACVHLFREKGFAFD